MILSSHDERIVVGEFPRKLIDKSSWEKSFPRFVSKEPVQFFKSRKFLIVGPGELSTKSYESPTTLVRL